MEENEKIEELEGEIVELKFQLKKSKDKEMIYLDILSNIDTSLKISKNNFFTIGVIFCIINYFAFIHTNKWKAYIIKFDRLPPNKNKLGGWAVFLIAIFVVANLIFSFYLISQIPRPR